MNALIRKQGAELALFALVFVVVFSQIKFFTTGGSDGNVEQWVNLTNQFFYGSQDFLFSYGPLYWLNGGTFSMYSPLAYWISVAFVSFVAAFFWAILFALSFRSRGYLLIAVAYFLFFGTLALPATMFLWPFALVMWLEFSESTPLRLGRKALLLLGAVIGFAFYVRFFYGTIAIATFGSYFFSRLLVSRKLQEVAWLIIGVFVGYLVVGFFTFHDSSNIIKYFVINSQLNYGNSVDMTLDVGNSRRTFAAAAVVALCVNAFVLLRRRRLFLTANVLLLILFKIGFSRADHYLVYFVVPVAAVSCMLVFDRDRLGKVLFVVAVAALYFVGKLPSFPGAPTRDALAEGVDFTLSYQTRLERAYPEYKLDPAILQKIGRSAIDVYPYNNEYLLSNNLNYRHRPLFQNYMTLTPKLDAMNRDFFESPNRPQFVLWTAGIGCNSKDCNPFGAFDQKWGMNEDPLTSSTILLNYHVTDIIKVRNGVPAALLEANPTVTPYSETPIASERMKLGQWYPVPASREGVVKLKPQLNFTIAGRLKNMLLWGEVLKVKYKLSSGEVIEFRTNLLNARNGIWVSPLIENFAFEGARVDAVMLETRNANYLKPVFDSDWVSVPIKAVHVAKPRVDAFYTLPADVHVEAPFVCDGFIDSVNARAPIPARIQAKGTLKVQGWLAYSAKDGKLADATLITITDPAGNTQYVTTHVQQRPDVGAAFQQPAISDAGYETQIDLSSLKGDYTLGLAEIKDSRLYACKQHQLALTVEP